MLRSSLMIFLENSQAQAVLKAIVITNLKKNEFHKKLRHEIVMMPIPKPSVMNYKIIGHQNPENFIDEIYDKQRHNLELALDRVRYYFSKHSLIMIFFS